MKLKLADALFSVVYTPDWFFISAACVTVASLITLNFHLAAAADAVFP